jgi:hypothetical protein
MAWMNGDGLYIKFGTEEVAVTQAGEYNQLGPLHYIEAEINWDELEAFGTTTFLSETVKLPDGVYLEKAEFEVSVAFAGASATISFGTIDTDRTTAHDADGIDVQIATTSIDAAGDTITCDGALIGTVLDNTTPMLLTALVETADFTAGQGFLRVYYRHI